MRNALTLFALFILFVLGTLILTVNTPAASAQAPTPTGERPRPIQQQVTPTPVTPTPIPAIRTATSVKLVGNMVSANQASLAFTSAGRVKELPVAEGTKVQAGTLLGSLDTTVLEAQLAQSQAAYDQVNASFIRTQQGPSPDEIAVAKSNVDRAQAAVDQAQASYDRAGGARNPTIGLSGVSTNLQTATLAYQIALAQFNLTVNHPTPTELEVAQAQLKQAKVALDLAKQNLANVRLLAPFEGTLISITPKVGESVTANTAVMVLADLTKMQVLVNADETTLASIKVGQKATVTADALGTQVLTGTVKKIGLLATTTTTVVTVPVWIELAATNAFIYPGLSATVEIATTP